MRSVKTLVLGILVLTAAPGLRAQATGAAQAVKKSATEAAAQAGGQAAKPGDKAPAKPAAQNAPKTAAAPAKAAAAPSGGKPAAAPGKAAPQTTKTSPKPAKSSQPSAQAAGAAGKAGAKKPAAKRTAKPAAKTQSVASAVEREPKIARRDPFESMIGREHSGGGPTTALPAGKAGLQVSTLRLDGVVRAPNGMIAVVSNPQLRTYFLREGDQLFDGRVEKIAMDGVSFHEVGKDAFGKPVERQVNKRIYASAGEQQ
jgi:membrane protein involved in colicin uptake